MNEVPVRPWSSRRLIRDAWLAGCALLVAEGAEAQQYHRFAPPPEWVDAIAAEQPSRASAVNGDSVEILLLDRQVNVTADGDEHYQRLVTRMLNAAGVDRYSQVDFVVDPTYQTLDIHWLRLVRDGVEIDVRPSARITELAQEADLRNRIYNGRYTVNVVLSDVRAGDVLDYAYSLRSREQLYPGHFYTRLDLGWGVPVMRQRLRIVSPADRALRYRLSNGSPLPPPATRGTVREMVLDTRNVPAVAADARAPGWYTQWPFVEVSDLPSWATAAQRVLPLYRQPLRGALVDEVVARVAAAGGSQTEQALRALQWVQEEVRYTSISIGRGSHEPTPPDGVIERRYGDCKDKSLLLATVLTALGVEANVALVHSWHGRALEDTLPSPYAFDHAIVRAKIGDSVYWLDPTSETQLGSLSVDRSPSFARALVLAADTDGLEVIPQPGADVRARDISVVLDARGGVSAPATLAITTRYSGALAESMRAAFTTGTPQQWENDYASYTARYYPTAKVRAPLQIADERGANVIEVREQYSIDSAFAANDAGLLELTLHADDLYQYGEPLGAGSRQAPLALEYPIRVRQRIVAHLPEAWPVKEEDVVVENPAFRYRGRAAYASNTLTLTYDYQALDDHVPVSAIAQYETDRARMNDDLGYVLTYNPALEGALPSAVAPLPMIVLLLSLGGACWAAFTAGLRFDPPPGTTDDYAPVGISGWLLVPALSVLATPFWLIMLVSTYLPFIGAELWQTLPSLVAPAYASSVNIVVLATLCASVLLSVMSLLVAWLFFRRRTSAPVLYIALQWTSILIFTSVLIWGVASGFDTENTKQSISSELFRDLLAASIWTAYLLSSRRVRATFVRRYRPAQVLKVAAAGAAA